MEITCYIFFNAYSPSKDRLDIYVISTFKNFIFKNWILNCTLKLKPDKIRNNVYKQVAEKGRLSIKLIIFLSYKEKE